MYAKCFKRLFDFLISLIAISILSPVFIILSVIGIFAMSGNPFFVQKRPGRIKRNGKERIFRLIKFRTMSNKKDADGNLLPDKDRLSKYGKFLRATSLDELPELFNIFLGHMAIIGPRPLLVSYLDRYTEVQRRRHLVRPGLTGLAQVSGRNAISWEEKFELDVAYVESISFWIDVKIFFRTIRSVLKREGINAQNSATAEEFKGSKND